MPRDGNSGVFLRTAVGKTIIGSDQLEIQLLDDLSPQILQFTMAGSQEVRKQNPALGAEQPGV